MKDFLKGILVGLAVVEIILNLKIISEIVEGDRDV